jgi:hypothetical protein
MSEIMTAISSVGFPIAACVGMGWFFKYFYDKSCEQNSKMADAINNNTAALLKLSEKLDGDKGDGK